MHNRAGHYYSFVVLLVLVVVVSTFTMIYDDDSSRGVFLRPEHVQNCATRQVLLDPLSHGGFSIIGGGTDGQKKISHADLQKGNLNNADDKRRRDDDHYDVAPTKNTEPPTRWP